MPTQTKIDKVAGLKERFSRADNIFVTDYVGLNVEQITRLRKDLRENGIKYIVAKNTLMQIAAREAGYDDVVQHLSGPTAIAFSNADPNVPAKIFYDAGKEFSEIGKPAVKVFYIDRQSFPAADVERIANLPSRAGLLSRLVAAVESPMVGLVGTLEGILRELIGTVEALAKNRGEG